MRVLLVTIALAAAGSTAQRVDAAVAPDAPGDPLRSAECREALASLHRDEEAAAAVAASGPAADAQRPDAQRPRPIPAKLEASRRKAADACLHGRDDPAPARQPGGSPARPPPVQAPIAVPRLSPERPALPGWVRREPPAPVTRPAERPRFITTCDAIGCWADDGSRLDRVGPDLRGPRGLCTVQGTLLTCP